MINNFLKVKNLSQVAVENSEALRITHKSRSLQTGWSVVIPGGFKSHATKKIQDWRDRLGNPRSVSQDQRVKHLVADFPLWLAHTAKRLNISKDVVMRAAAADPNKIFSSSFAMRVVAENWYYHKRVAGEKGHIEENDARDLYQTTYLGIAWMLVTDDEAFRKLLEEILQDFRRIPTFVELQTLIGAV